MSNYRPRPLKFPRAGEKEETNRGHVLAESYEIKIPRLGGIFLDWKLYEFDAALTPYEAAREVLMRYDALVESGELPRSKSGGSGQSPKFTSEMNGITVFVRTVTSSVLTDDDDDDDDDDTFTDASSGAKKIRRRLFKFSAHTAVKLEYHLWEEGRS